MMEKSAFALSDARRRGDANVESCSARSRGESKDSITPNGGRVPSAAVTGLAAIFVDSMAATIALQTPIHVSRRAIGPLHFAIIDALSPRSNRSVSLGELTPHAGRHEVLWLTIQCGLATRVEQQYVPRA
jgi:hypothetical protein